MISVHNIESRGKVDTGDRNVPCNHIPGIANFLSGARVAKGDKFKVARSADQMAAEHIGKDTYLPSLEEAMK